MRDLFPGWVPPDEKTLDRYWNIGTLVVDTSVLLDLYRFSAEAREQLLTAIRSFDDRAWIPHQVALEYHRNRLGVLLDQRETEGNLLREMDQIREDLDGQLSQLLRSAGRRDIAPIREAINDAFDRLREKLSKAEELHTRGLGDSIRDDPIYEEVIELFSGRVGSPFSEERQTSVIEEAEERFRTRTPPGYLDQSKDEESRYGDVVLWHQLIQHASDNKKPVVLIADDQKPDWVWEVRGRSVGPRPELVAEMNALAGVGFYLYTPKRFLQIWEKREEGREVEPDVLAEIEGVGRSEYASRRLIKLQQYLEAHGLPPGLAGEDAGNRWIPQLIQSLEGLRPRASHFIGDDFVVLRLEFPPMQIPEDRPQVTVTDPGGNAATSGAGVAHSGEPGEGMFFTTVYPSAFSDADGLAPGTYEVAWEGIPPTKVREPEVTAKRLAAHTFTIEG